MNAAALTREELLALPAAVDLVTAGRALGVGRTKAHELARRGEWPTRLLRLGMQYRVPTADLLALLGMSPDMSEAGPASPAPATAHRPTWRVTNGDAHDTPQRLHAVKPAD